MICFRYIIYREGQKCQEDDEEDVISY